MIWVILAEKIENKVYVNQDDAVSDLKLLIRQLFLFLDKGETPSIWVIPVETACS